MKYNVIINIYVIKIKAYLGDIVGSVSDDCNKTNMAIKQISQ